MANCDDRCPVFRQIETIRAKCLACSVCGDSNTLQVGGSGMVHLDAADEPESILRRSTGKRHHEPLPLETSKEELRNVTALDAETEEKLRSVTTTFFGLKPIEVLLCHHLATGGNLGNFGEFIGKVQRDFGKYKHLDKRNAWVLFKRIGSVFGPFRALAGGLIGKGKGGAVKQALQKSIIQTEMEL